MKSTSQKHAKIQSYSLDFKFSVIEHAEKHGNSNTARVKRKRLGGSGETNHRPAA